jgi:hypothetical protein
MTEGEVLSLTTNMTMPVGSTGNSGTLEFLGFGNAA